jgi:hypothetical protein
MNHNHLSEEELILHYYGEEDERPDAARRLEECGQCRALYASLQRTLNVVDALPVPERDAEYGARVWERIEAQLSGGPVGWRRAFQLWPRRIPWRWAAAGAALAGLLATAFLAGRYYPLGRRAAPLAEADSQARESVLLVAVGDYLERSQMVLIELANANPKNGLDISAEQERAHGLVSEARLYRQTAEHTGDAAVAGVLDELERVLMDITHEPSRLSPEALEKLRERLKAEGILFKMRVLGSNVRREEEPAEPATARKL